MKTPPNLVLGGVDTGMIRASWYRQLRLRPGNIGTPPIELQPVSVSATKNGLEPACRTVKRDRGTNRLTTPASPVRDRTSTRPGMIPEGKVGSACLFGVHMKSKQRASTRQARKPSA